jgi:DNA-binding IclR family transcriptional regulator
MTPGWGFLTNHAQVLLCVAGDPDVLLRDIGVRVGITERAAHRILGELEASGYVARHKDGRRNRYEVNAHLPLPDRLASQRRVSELLTVLGGGEAASTSTQGSHAQGRRPGA